MRLEHACLVEAGFAEASRRDTHALGAIGVQIGSRHEFARDVDEVLDERHRGHGIVEAHLDAFPVLRHGDHPGRTSRTAERLEDARSSR